MKIGIKTDFVGTLHSLLFPIFFVPCPTSVTILWTLCVYTQITDTVQTVYELPLVPNNTAVKHFYTNRSGEKCWLDIYCRSGGNWANTWHWAERFTVCFWNSKWQQQPSYCHIVLLTAFLEEATIRNIIIILYINYNTVVINNNLWKTPRPYFAFQNPHWHAKEFFVCGGGFIDDLPRAFKNFRQPWRMQTLVIF